MVKIVQVIAELHLVKVKSPKCTDFFVEVRYMVLDYCQPGGIRAWILQDLSVIMVTMLGNRNNSLMLLCITQIVLGCLIL